MHSNAIERKPGRPRIIPKELEPEVISLYKQGFGYRATARELGKKGISVNWSTVRRLIKESLDENLNYRLKYCFGGVVAKAKENPRPHADYCLWATRTEINENLHHELEYCQGTAEVEHHENPRYQLQDWHMTMKERPKTNLNQR